MFVDSSFFIALAFSKDQWHEQALKLVPKLEKENKIVSGPIISEAVTLVGNLSGGKAGKMVYDSIIDNCTVFAPEKQLYEEAMQTYLKYDGTLSLTDTISLEVMKIFNIQEIVSFDSDFDKVKGIARIY
ncbi:type II toxin-antitoxin system VapC family toxin [Methanobacterium ferruginis]|uniref:type II toxin-antitoxin system VapC family toxin n=1 Tax=Methanobacterium ferruginis TaxID=710191 RepID=UPI002572DA06|nr:PIN domain-containing protein [Methanobacterium ferruginis]BDZ66721.1 hypothetical protein GCM10025860_01690 [Methanobacterium ferruginis]